VVKYCAAGLFGSDVVKMLTNLAAWYKEMRLARLEFNYQKHPVLLERLWKAFKEGFVKLLEEVGMSVTWPKLHLGDHYVGTLMLVCRACGRPQPRDAANDP
jgi:hypothetical protein